jgi:hypothetical protein
VGNDIQKPMGAPPGPPPSMAIKPPPMAPPPRNLVQTQQRPAPENIKPIDPNALTKKASLANISSPNLANGQPQPPSSPARGPPPRFPGAPIYGDPQLSDNPNGIVNRGAAPPKFSESARPTMPKKPGAVSMFEKPLQPQEVAPAKGPLPTGAPRPGPPPRGPGLPANPSPLLQTEPSADSTVAPKARIPRPLPPKPQPAGIPEGNPLPPEEKPEKEGAKEPPPVKPVPNRNRAPPREDPDAVANKASKTEIKAPDTEAPFVKGRKAAVEEEYVPRRQRRDAEFESSSSEEDTNGVKVKKIRIKKPAKTTPGTPATQPPVSEQQLSPASAPAPTPGHVPPPSQMSAPSSKSIVPADDVQKQLTIAQTPPKDQPVQSVSQTPQQQIVLHTVDKDVPPVDVGDEVTGTDVIAAPLQDVKDEGFALDFQSKIAKNLKNGRLSIRCIAGIDVRRKDDLNKIPRTDPYLKFKLGAAERHSWITTQIKRKQDNNPKFDDEIVHFDVLDPIKYVMNEDLHLVIELWNKSTLKDECMGTVAMSVVRFFSKPFMAFEEKVPVCYPNTKKVNGKVIWKLWLH